jgi:diguanylate cyclase (GGDEF)-like protein
MSCPTPHEVNRWSGCEPVGTPGEAAPDTGQTGPDGDHSSVDIAPVAVDRDQAAGDHDPASGADPDAHTPSRDTRQDAARLRKQTSQARLDAADRRDTSAQSRDIAALARDHSAAARDLAMAQSDAADAQAHRERALTDSEMVRRATQQRQRVAEYRAEAQADRAHAAEDRQAAANDRQAAAEDREQAVAELRRVLAEQVALSRELAITETDSLTGARTRAAGLTDLDHELQRCRRTSNQLVVAYVDVIGLKSVNDTRGHDAGDRLLKRSVTVIRGHLRPYDLIIRLGGDEFLCAMSNMTMPDARRRFSAIAAALAETPMAPAIRTGFAELAPEQTAADLIASADSHLINGPHSKHDS